MTYRLIQTIACLLSIAMVCATSTFAADSVIVQSGTFSAGASDQTIAIKIINQDTLKLVCVPLEIRSLTPGCMPSTLTLSYSERLLTGLTDLRISNMYPQKDGTCMSSGAAAYEVPIYSGADTSYQVGSDPWGVSLLATYIYNRNFIPPGSDSVGSLILTFDAPNVAGSFVIDTVCTSPANHLHYLIPNYVGKWSSREAVPSFVAGIVTVVDCACAHHGDLNGDGQVDVLDFNALLDWIFYSIGPPPTDSTCTHIDRGDVNCDGADDALDINYLSDHLFFSGSPPCDPCACDPYPSSCP